MSDTSMLTFSVSSERFSDGDWEEMIQKGYIRRLLERLNQIRTDEMTADFPTLETSQL